MYDPCELCLGKDICNDCLYYRTKLENDRHKREVKECGMQKITIERICEKCNKGYRLDVKDVDLQRWNKTTCPNCGDIDTPWISIKKGKA